MKASFSVLTRLASCAVLGTMVLSGCGGGGSSTVPTTAATVQTPSTSGNVPIGSLNLNQSASSTAVAVTGSTPAGPTVDVDDRATIGLTGTGATADVSDSTHHSFAGALRGTPSSSAHRATKDVAVNSPFDLTNHGGPVLGSAVSHDLFLNCNLTCRQAGNFDPGHFLADLGKDDFITLLYQYLVGPGVVDATPLTGRYTKGTGADFSTGPLAPLPGDTNGYFGQLDIISLVLFASQQPQLGGGGDGHIYHVFLPKNIDTCFEAPLGTPTGSCYSPDNGGTFAFCAYHGSFRLRSNPNKFYLYTVEPYQDVPGCRNNVHNQALPNAVSPTVDPADPGYSTLSHELFETISDPHGNAWFNGFSGNEIGDLCADFDNFVTVNGHHYVLQSEYSDIHHICVSGNLTSGPQTPQNLFGD